MKYFKFILTGFIACYALFIIVSCKKEDNNFFIDNREISLRQRIDSISMFGNNFIVPLEIAINIAKRVNLNAQSGNLIANNDFDILEHFVIRDSLNTPVLYVFNYVNDGLAVISADERHEPICAIIPHGKYEATEMPAGLIGWFEDTYHNIKLLRNGIIDNTARARTIWIDILSRTDEYYRMLFNNCCEDCPNFPDCLDIFELGCGDPNIICDPCGTWQTTTVGPLMSTIWGQRCTFNEQCPAMGCNVCWSNNRAPTGCVATSVAQVLRYWAHPSSHAYDYANMPNEVGNADVQRMMRDIGNSVNMNYGCDGSGANSNRIPNCFKNTYGYGSAKRSSYSSGSYQTVISNLNAGKPVILDGCRTRKNWILFYTYHDCHSWVCDGYQRHYNNCISYLLFYMNWGWRGVGNGWFAFNNWNSPNGTYQYAQDFCYDINP